MEIASHLSTLGRCESVSVVGRGEVPFSRSLGNQVGERLQRLLEQQGVKFYMKDGVAEIVGRERVEQVWNFFYEFALYLLSTSGLNEA